jgi:hypothetical protein
MGTRGTRRKHYKKHGQKVTNNYPPRPQPCRPNSACPNAGPFGILLQNQTHTQDAVAAQGWANTLRLPPAHLAQLPAVPESGCFVKGLGDPDFPAKIDAVSDRLNEEVAEPPL